MFEFMIRRMLAGHDLALVALPQHVRGARANPRVFGGRVPPLADLRAIGAGPRKIVALLVFLGSAMALYGALVEALGSPGQKAEARAHRDAVQALWKSATPLMTAMEYDADAFVAWQTKSAELGEVGAMRWLLAAGRVLPAGACAADVAPANHATAVSASA